MKKAILTGTALAVLAMSAPSAHAGDREWATAGKVLTGVGAGLLIAKAFEPRPYTPPPVVVVQSAPAVVYQPAPVVVQQPVQVVYQPVQVVQQPVQVVQQPVVYQQVIAQPVYVQPAPVYYAPPPPVYVPAPVYVGYGHHHHFHHHHGPRVGVHFSFGRHW